MKEKPKIEKQQVEHVAKLARLFLSQKEIEKMQKELSRILDYIEKLKEVDVSQVEPTNHSVLIRNIMRKDEEREKSKEIRSKLMDLMPDKKGNYLKVRKVI